MLQRSISSLKFLSIHFDKSALIHFTKPSFIKKKNNVLAFYNICSKFWLGQNNFVFQEVTIIHVMVTCVLNNVASNSFQLNPITCSAVSHDKRWLVTGDVGPDAMVNIWDTYTGWVNNQDSSITFFSLTRKTFAWIYQCRW